MITLADIVNRLGGALVGDESIAITGIAPLAQADNMDISFLSNAKYQSQLMASKAACVIVSEAMREAAKERGNAIVTADPYLYFAKLTQWWKAQHSPTQMGSIHPSSVIDASAQVDATATIGPLCVLEAGAVIGAHTVLASRVTVGRNCSIGSHCMLHAGSVIGSDGFGFAPHQGTWEKIEQLGNVRIGDHVEIGANTCIDRGALGDTVLEDGVKLDNLIQIAHNVHVGAHTAMAACVGIAGSAKIGKHCTIGGAAVVLGHLTVADHVSVSASTTVTKSITQPGLYTGLYPMEENSKWEKNAVSLKQLNQLREHIKCLEKQLKALS